MVDDNQRVIRESWEANADAWTVAVQGQLIPSRRAGTDAAIVAVCTQLRPQRVLDVGCGKGWLARALAAASGQVVGADASPALIASARAGGGAEYVVIDYEALTNDDSQLPGPWDLIVCNYSLFGDPLTPLLAALERRLGPGGRLVIQTVHPWMAVGDGAYANGWREETFADFGVDFPASMPWYFRTLDSWIAEIREAGLVDERVDEPVNSATGRPLSLILQCASLYDEQEIA